MIWRACLRPPVSMRSSLERKTTDDRLINVRHFLLTFGSCYVGFCSLCRGRCCFHGIPAEHDIAPPGGKVRTRSHGWAKVGTKQLVRDP